ncbi:MAG: DNA polymerase I [Ignavibacteria bacterium]|jgi:DNA polymerase-1|nr:DNA polymerase I [Ignavibacteria bacterium]MDH7527084.1 DNA polymerase I [Ignavibacteria bacterium]
MKKAFLIDGMSMAYKAYFAFISRPLRNSKNQNTSAVYGFLSSLLKILENEKPDYIAVAFDTKEKTFRHDKFPEYKANRQLIPDDMIYQLDYIKKILKAIDIEIITAPGFEADDIIGTLSKKFKENKVQSYLVTPDKDFLQLIEDGIYVYKPLKKSVEDAEVYDINKVKEEYGLTPEQFIDFLALTGDPTDNIPGVKGIGEKTALELIKEFGSLDNIYKSIDKINKVALKQKLIDGKEMAYLSRELVTIKRNIPIDVDLENLKIKSPDVKTLENLLNELEIKTFNKRLENLLNTKIKSSTPTLFDTEELEKPEIKIKEIDGTNYILLDSEEKIRQFILKAEKSDLIVFDTETDNLNSIDANLVGLSFCLNKSEAYFYKLENHRNFDAKENDRKNLKLFKKILEDQSKLKIGQNLKYDINVLYNYGIDVQPPFFDTMVAAYVFNPDGVTGLDDMAKKYLNYDTYKISALIGDKKNSALMWNVPVNDLKIYSCEDADITYQLYLILKEELKSKELIDLCEEIEFPLVKTLSDMELRGVYINTYDLQDLSIELGKQISNIEAKIYELAGEEFNVNSTKQLQEILFVKLKLEPTKKTKTGYSTDIQSLEQMRFSHPIIEHLINYRQLVKLKNTYVDSLPELINKRTGRIHTNYNQTITSTGRLSSSDPNLQNIPIRSEMGKEIRRAFAASDENWKILSADYSQIELRILAHICEDPNLIQAFENDLDIHAATASKVYGVPIDQVTPEMRRKAKEVNFGILYGIGPFGLKTRLGISQTAAKELIDRYFRTYKKVHDYLEETKKFAHKNGYVETLKKRRRYLPNINSQNATVRSAEERQAINMPIQGTAADMIKIAMNNISKYFRENKLKSAMIIQVHDELVFEVHKDELEEVKRVVKKEMEEAIKLKVPVKVDIGIGNNWLDAH